MRQHRALALTGILALAAAAAGDGTSAPAKAHLAESQPETTPAGEQAVAENYVLDHKADRIDGESEELDTYLGKVILIVNVASECGFTDQYEQLEALYKEYRDEGFVILAFPANNFGGQEPGSNEEILEFCTSKFDVTFPMFSKIEVLGDDVHPLYKQLAEQPEPIGGDPEWNFTKFLVNRKGEVVERFGTRISPDDKKVVEPLVKLLKADEE